MRYENTNQKKDDLAEAVIVETVEAGDRLAEQKITVLPERIEAASEEAVDQFQACVYNAGAKALSLLDGDELTKGLELERRESARKTLEQLSAFRYNIGFAGPQSCGKSSLINTMIRYPLMPTCTLATTCTPVELIYGKETRIVVKDEDRNGQIVFDRKCTSVTQEDFQKLVNYASKVMPVAVIENLQFFCDSSILNEAVARDLKQHLKMDQNDPKQVAMLFLILFTVYAHQNNRDLNRAEMELNELRVGSLRYFGIPDSTINYCVVIQWDDPLLASGLMITDLPGLGSSAEDRTEDGVVIKGHDTITKEAILRTDTMAFISEPQVLADAVPALETMISNSNLRDAVSVEDRIVPIMNKVDTVMGQQRRTAIDMMLGMMKNAGANMDNRKVWETSSFYGEYVYEGLNGERSFYAQREMYKLAETGYEKEEIKIALPNILLGMEMGYKKSNMDDLRNFFRTAFIGRGKYQKSISAIVALRTLALDMVSTQRTFIKTHSALASVTSDVAYVALDYLEKAALKPLNEAVEGSQAIEDTANQHIDIVEAMVKAATSTYETALSNADEEYADRLRRISCQFDLTWFGIGNRARVDTGHPKNHKLYQQLLEESDILKVDLKDVNKIHADALRYCGNTVAGIYESALARLVAFQKEYPRILSDCIDRYRGEAAPSVIALMESLLPSLQQYVSIKILTAQSAIQDRRSSFQGSADRLAREIILLNDEFVKVLLDMVRNKLSTMQGGWFMRNRVYLEVDGSNGLNATLNNLGLTNADRNRIKGLLGEKGSEVILDPLRLWYMEAQQDVNEIIASLSFEFNLQFKKMKETLEKQVGTMEDEIKHAEDILKKLVSLFEEMQESIQPKLDLILESEGSGNSPLKGDLFEGMLKDPDDKENDAEDIDSSPEGVESFEEDLDDEEDDANA